MEVVAHLGLGTDRVQQGIGERPSVGRAIDDVLVVGLLVGMTDGRLQVPPEDRGPVVVRIDRVPRHSGVLSRRPLGDRQGLAEPSRSEHRGDSLAADHDRLRPEAAQHTIVAGRDRDLGQNHPKCVGGRRLTLGCH